jgi:long-subunit acyl-CoA synthetase (AMP-forming)
MFICKGECADLLNIFNVLAEKKSQYHYSGDLWSAHPTKDNLWKYHGRTDAIVSLGTGSATSVIPIELVVQESPLVKRVTVVGEERVRLCLVVEFKENKAMSADERKGLVDEIWEYVEKSNSESTETGRLRRKLIVVTPLDKPFPRTQKGTINLSGVAEMLEDEQAGF